MSNLCGNYSCSCTGAAAGPNGLADKGKAYDD